MKKTIYLILLLFCFSTVSISCFEDIFGLEDEEEEISATTNEKPGYDFSFTCAIGSKKTVPISAGTEKCQKAQEYFAKMYGCNEADYFNEANCKVCKDCGWTNYCSVCN